MYGSKRVLVRDLNPHILCALCGGYLIHATTVIECLHSFCRTCIVKFLETSKVCPICDAQIHKTRPLLNIRPDQTLQSLVYKLVPGLFQDEMRRRREFHATLPESDLEDLTLEERGEAKLEKEFKQGDDHVSLILQMAFRKEGRKSFKVKDTRYLLCPSEVTIRHLKRFIKAKFDLGEQFKIEMFRGGEELTDEMMLQDVALIYSWRGDRPMCICYTVTEEPRPQKALATPKSIKSETTTQGLTRPQSCRKNSIVKQDLDSSDLLSETLTACHLSSPTSCSIVSDSSSETCLSILSSTQESYEDSSAIAPQKTLFTESNKTASVAAKAITAPTSATPKTITALTTVAVKTPASTAVASNATIAPLNTTDVTTKTTAVYKTTTVDSKTTTAITKTTTATTKIATMAAKTTTLTTKNTADYKTTTAASMITAETAKTTTATVKTTTAAAKTTTATAKTTSANAKSTTGALSTISSSPIKPHSSPVGAGLKILASTTSFPTPSTHKDILNDNKNAITENHDRRSDLGDSTIKFTQHSVQSILSSSKKKSHQNVDLPLSWKPVVYPGVESVTSTPPVKTEDILTLLSSSVNVGKTKQQSQQNSTQIQADKLVAPKAQSQIVSNHDKAGTREKCEWNSLEKLDSSKRLKDKPLVNQISSVNQGSSISHGLLVNQCQYLVNSKSTEKMINSPNKAHSKDRDSSVKNSSKLPYSKPHSATDCKPPEIGPLPKRTPTEGSPAQNSSETNDRTMASCNLNPLVKTNTTNSVLTTNSEVSPKVLVKLTNPPDDDNSIFASYIPKFQKHHKFSSVKRSLSCEGQSPSAQLDLEHSKSPGSGDSMEKRNWKKRKLSTMDFDSPASSPLRHDDPGASRKTLLDSSKPTSSHQEIVSAHNDPYAFTANDSCALSEIIPVRKPNPNMAKGSGIRLNQTSIASSSVFSPYANLSHIISPQNGLTNRGPKQEISANGKVSDSSLFKTKYTISKGKLGQDISTNTLTGYKDRSPLPITSSAKASKHAKKTCSSVQAEDKLVKSHHSNLARSLSEISVDISSSPSDASSVTSPATDVTSPGTEDRTDTSALPDMAAPCDNDCVSTYQSRGVPLDLSSKRKK